MSQINVNTIKNRVGNSGPTIDGNTTISGIVTADYFYGDGTNLTGIAVTEISNDTTPQLGGDLDGNSKNINNVGIITATSFSGNLTGVATYTSEWDITSNGSDDYRFSGPGFDGTENDPTIYLVRGQEYKFTNEMNAHPFEIRTAINGSAYNDGIVNNAVSNGTLTWDVQMDAPNILYYQCTSHPDMNGKIYIGNSGDSIGIGTQVTINATGVDVTGVVTATSFSGIGSNLTQLTGAGVGTYGNSTATPVIVVNDDGRITGISTTAIAGGWKLLSVIDASEAASVTFQEDLDGTYDQYVITGIGVTASSTTDTHLFVRFMYGATELTTTQYDSSMVAKYTQVEGIGHLTYSDQSAGRLDSFVHDSDNYPDHFTNFTFWMEGGKDAALHHLRFETHTSESYALGLYTAGLVQYYNSNVITVDGLKIYMAAGNISGKFKLYGLS